MSTLFIDELGKMPMYLQHKLLRYLETREILPLGAAEPRIIDARIIAAIQPDELEDDKSILPDLKYRLGYPDVIYMPSLGDLIEDYGNNIIDISFVRIWEKMNIGHSGDYLTINERCYTLLRNRIFKGNFRELENILRGAIISTFAKQTDEIQPEDLPISNPSEREPTDCMQENSLYGNIPEFEKLKLSEICEFAENESAKWMKYIVREKVHHALNQHGNLRSALKSEGRHSNKEYQKCRDDIMRLTGMKVNEIKAV